MIQDDELPFDRPGPPYTGAHHPGTSWEAAENVAAAAASHRRIILEELARRGEVGATGYELAPLLGCTPNNACARLLELRETNQVIRTDERRTTSGPRYKAHVHVLAPAQVQ